MFFNCCNVGKAIIFENEILELLSCNQ